MTNINQVMQNGQHVTFNPVLNFPEYIVSTCGRYVIRIKTGRIKSQRLRQGYLRVELWKDGKAFSMSVSRIVYESIKGEIELGHQIDHLNFDTEDNRIENLESVTGVVNNQRARKHYSGGVKKPKTYKATPLSVGQVDDRGRLVQYYPTFAAAAKDRKLSNACLPNHLAGLTETCGGCRWVAFEEGVRLGRMLPPIPSTFAKENAFYKFKNWPGKKNQVRFSWEDIQLKKHLNEKD